MSVIRGLEDHIERVIAGASGLSSTLTRQRPPNQSCWNVPMFSVNGMPPEYLAPAGSPIAVGRDPQLMTPCSKDLHLTWISLAAFFPASSTSSWLALPFSMVFFKS